MKIAVFLTPCEEGGFSASIPSLPGCISEGETVDEALANIREAFELYVEPTEDDLIPEEDDAILRELELDWGVSPETEAITTNPAPATGTKRLRRFNPPIEFTPTSQPGAVLPKDEAGSE